MSKKREIYVTSDLFLYEKDERTKALELLQFTVNVFVGMFEGWSELIGVGLDRNIAKLVNEPLWKDSKGKINSYFT